MDLNYIKKSSWYRQQTESNPYFIYNPCMGCFHWIKGKNDVFCLCKEDEVEWYFNQSHFLKLAKEYLNKEKKVPGNMRKIYRDWISKVVKNNDKIFRLIDGKNISTIKDAELVRYNKSLASLTFNMWNFFLIDIYDIDAEALIENELVDNKITMSSEDKAIMMMQDDLIVHQQEEKSLLKIAKLIKETPGASNTLLYISAPSNLHRLKLHPEIERAIIEHQKKYFWTRNSWGHATVVSVFEVVEVIKQILSGPRDIKNELYNLEHYRKELKIKKQKIIKKYRMSKWLGHMFSFFSLLTLWRDERKVEVQKLNHYLELVGTEMAKRSGLTWQQIKVCDPKKINKIPVNKKFLNKYKKLFNERYLVIWDGRKTVHLKTKEIKKIESSLKSTFNTRTTEIRGMIGCPGKVKGEVVIINKKSEFEKMKEGKILVTAMTRPEFIPLMKKASAIITDEGGITSHAAIVSREMKTPCVIGTKIATKVLKDGDIVEVNANHGIVRVSQ